MVLTGAYTWTETSEDIKLSIPLKGTSPKNTDVFVAETIVKVSYSPYLLDLNLAGNISDAESKAVFENGVLAVRLKKKAPGIWGKLLFDGSKIEREGRRYRAVRDKELRVREQHDLAKKRRQEEERMSLQKQVRARLHGWAARSFEAGGIT